MAYIDIYGHPTWVEDRGGSGTPLLLLHGGLSNSDALLDSIGPGLADFHLIAFDRRGHGYTADTDAGFHYADMATETIGVLEEVAGGAAHLVGWSDGGNVALLVALQRPDLVRKMVVIGSNYHYDGVLPLEPESESSPSSESSSSSGSSSSFMQAIGAEYIRRSPDGAGHLDIVFEKSFAMFSSEPTLTTADLATIPHPTLVMVGDDDLITLAHTCSLYEALPAGQLAVLPRASHAVPIEQPERVVDLIRDFLAAPEPPATVMPIRRARSSPARGR